MNIENDVRQVLHDIADDIPAVDGLAATALRRARKRRYVARTGIAVAAAAAVSVPVGVSALRDPGGPDPSIAGPAAAGPPSSSSVLAAPAARDLNSDELAQALQLCAAGFEREADHEGYAGWTPVFGIEVDVNAPRGVPVTWVAAKRGDDFRADCALDSDGDVVAGGGAYGLKSTPGYLYALVDGQEGVGVGRYVHPVATVTVQYLDEPEQQAVLRDGFWFSPLDELQMVHEHADETADQEEREQAAVSDGHDLIGVPPGYVFRGYDASGDLVYDSSADGPTIDDCYVDPTGAEFVGNHAERDDESECVVTHAWQPSP